MISIGNDDYPERAEADFGREPPKKKPEPPKEPPTVCIGSCNHCPKCDSN